MVRAVYIYDIANKANTRAVLHKDFTKYLRAVQGTRIRKLSIP